jgi:formate-dependent nitrite reductase cytochrome c552 subunit
MKKNNTLTLKSSGFFILCLVMFFAPGARAEEPAHDFIGAKMCALCHKKTEQGLQLQIWQESKHSKAFGALAAQEAKDIAASMGIDDPQASGKCLKCHATAYWFSEERKSEDVDPEEGVSCESCHGPGKDYKSKSVMSDHNAALAAGLLDPAENTCRKCHNEESPTFKTFDYASQYEKIKHPKP